MNAFAKLTQAALKGFARDRTALFFSLFFPLLFMLLFGSIFGGSGGGPSLKLDVGVVVHDPSPTVSWVPGAFRRVPVFAVHTGTEAVERSALLHGKRAAVVIFPAQFSSDIVSATATPVTVLYDPSQAQTAQLTLGIISQFLDGIERRMSGRPTLLEVKEQPVTASASGGKLREVDYLIPGILALTVMQLGLFTAIPIVNMRERGILKRFRATPLPRSTLVLSQVVMRLIVALAQMLVLVAIAMAVFHFHIAGSWPQLIGVTVFGALTFISVGAVLASLVRTQESAAPLIQLVNVPMMFLSGMFFPTSLMPKFLQPVTNAIPATYLADAMRSVALNTPSGHSLSLSLAVLAGWLVVCLAIAMRTFRWE